MPNQKKTFGKTTLLDLSEIDAPTRRTPIASSIMRTSCNTFSSLRSTFAATSVAASLLLMSPNLAALGLGALEVQSNLDQPLNGVIELRVASGDDVNSVTAQIADKEDFQKLGIEYPGYMKDISLQMDTVDGQKVLRVDSDGVIIKEPFIHFLVRVNWSGGSFLREYTALIDPPAYAIETPRALAEPRSVGTDQSYQAEEFTPLEVEEIDDSETVDELFTEPEPEPEAEPEPIVEEPVLEEEPEFEVEEEFVAEEIYEEPETSSLESTDAQYGPVASGETLSQIAEELQRQFPDLSIYQIMKVLFEENKSSFIQENINGLIKGSVLNIGDLNVIRAVDVAESKQFFFDQISEWSPEYLIASGDDSVKVGQDEYAFNDDVFSDDSVESATDSTEDDAFQVGATTETESFVSETQGDNSEGEVLALQQKITDLESSLSSSSLENQELTERISILEGQLADMNRLMSLNVEDAEMASVESTLAEQNDAEEVVADDTLAVDDSLLGDESLVDDDSLLADDSLIDDALFADDDSLLGDDSSLIDDSSSEFESSLQAVGEEGVDLLEGAEDALIGDDDSLLGDDDSLAVEDSLIVDNSLEDVADSVVEEAEAEQPAPVIKSSKSSMVDDIKAKVIDSGMWKIITIVGGLLAGGLGLFLWRRRRSDEEFEVSMLSIESQSQTVGGHSKESTMATEASITQTKSEVADKETSFLTVYSDSDAVVQADEVDPIAEADVYIAYGRDEQAEEVLLDGVVSNPDRIDIKHKLLGLYHKNGNVEGFERISEELYAQKSVLTAEVWQEVSSMGKDLLPDNPMFDVSVDDLLVVDQDDATESTDDAADSIEVSSEIDDDIVDAIAADDESAVAEESSESEEDPSVNLINFDDEVSELDDVKIDTLDVDQDAADDDGTVEIDLADLDDLEDDEVEYSSSVTEVSDLEIDEDYDEARTQYELAKVFVDLGDEDGARKILEEIVANKDNSEEVLKDANELLESIS